MKIEKHFYLLIIVTTILCTPACGEVESPRYAESSLISQANPTLAGLEELYVLVALTDSEPNKNAQLCKEIETQIENKLKDAGIKLLPSLYLGQRVIPLGIPTLKVEIGMLKLNDSQQYVFHVQMSLSRMVHLAKQPKLDLMADVWKTEPVMEATSIEDAPAKINEIVLQQVNIFIESYYIARTQVSQPPDVNETVPLGMAKSIKPPDRQTVPAKPVAVQYKYVASKNSQVFHRPDCSSARRINPENLIGYNTPDEAIQSGKRPCKRCKP